MPSPFPGMDPFLEHPAVFPDFHDRFIGTLSDMLNNLLPPPYYTGLASRVWVEVSQRPIGPDVDVLHPAVTGGAASNAMNLESTVAVEDATAPVVVHVPMEEVREVLPDDPPVRLDLQSVFDECFERGKYSRRLRYRDWRLSPELSPEQAAWVEQILQGVET